MGGGALAELRLERARHGRELGTLDRPAGGRGVGGAGGGAGGGEEGRPAAAAAGPPPGAPPGALLPPVRGGRGGVQEEVAELLEASREASLRQAVESGLPAEASSHLADTLARALESAHEGAAAPSPELLQSQEEYLRDLVGFLYGIEMDGAADGLRAKYGLAAAAAEAEAEAGARAAGAAAAPSEQPSMDDAEWRAEVSQLEEEAGAGAEGLGVSFTEIQAVEAAPNPTPGGEPTFPVDEAPRTPTEASAQIRRIAAELNKALALVQGEPYTGEKDAGGEPAGPPPSVPYQDDFDSDVILLTDAAKTRYAPLGDEVLEIEDARPSGRDVSFSLGEPVGVSDFNPKLTVGGVKAAADRSGAPTPSRPPAEAPAASGAADGGGAAEAPADPGPEPLPLTSALISQLQVDTMNAEVGGTLDDLLPLGDAAPSEASEEEARADRADRVVDENAKPERYLNDGFDYKGALAEALAFKQEIKALGLSDVTKERDATLHDFRAGFQPPARKASGNQGVPVPADVAAVQLEEEVRLRAIPWANDFAGSAHLIYKEPKGKVKHFDTLGPEGKQRTKTPAAEIERIKQKAAAAARGSKARPPLAPKAVQPKKKPAEAPKPKPKPAPARKAKRAAKPPAAAKPSSRSQVRAEKLAAAAGGRKTITLSALLQNNDTVAEAKARAKAKVKAMETKRVATISTQTEDAEVGGALAGEGSGEAATRRPSYMSEIDRSLDPDLIRSGERREPLLDSRIRLPGERRAQGPGADPGPSPFRYSAEGKDIERAVVTEVVDSVFSDVLSQLPQRHAFTFLPPALPIRVAPNADMQVRLLVTERVDEALSGALASLKHYRPPAPEERADDVADSTVKLVSSMLLEEEAAKLGSTDFAAEPSRPEAGPDPAAGASAEFRAAPGVPERRRRGRGATASPTGPQVPEVHRYSVGPRVRLRRRRPGADALLQLPERAVAGHATDARHASALGHPRLRRPPGDACPRPRRHAGERGGPALSRGGGRRGGGGAGGDPGHPAGEPG